MKVSIFAFYTTISIVSISTLFLLFPDIKYIMYGINEQLKEFMEEKHKLDLKYLGEDLSKQGKRNVNVMIVKREIMQVNVQGITREGEAVQAAQKVGD